MRSDQAGASLVGRNSAVPFLGLQSAVPACTLGLVLDQLAEKGEEVWPHIVGLLVAVADRTELVDRNRPALPEVDLLEADVPEAGTGRLVVDHIGLVVRPMSRKQSVSEPETLSHV